MGALNSQSVMYIVVSFKKKLGKEFLDSMKLANRSEHTFPVKMNFQKHETEVSNSQLYRISVVYFFKLKQANPVNVHRLT